MYKKFFTWCFDDGLEQDKKIIEILKDFFQTDPGADDLFFLMFAHGYEFNFGTKESNRNKFKRICESVSAPSLRCSFPFFRTLPKNILPKNLPLV